MKKVKKAKSVCDAYRLGGLLSRLGMIFAMCMMIIAINGFSISASEGDISIDRSSSLLVGKALGISKAETVTEVKWFSADKMVSEEETYTPVADDYEHWITVKGYDSDGKEVASDKVYFSKLPVVYINTADGSKIADKNEKAGHMSIQGNMLFPNQYDGDITVKLRGNSSVSFDQKPYKIKLDKKTDLFGMGKNKHWALISNFIDQCALRNVLGSNISKQLGVENMDTTWVDVVVNGEYRGMYIFCEHVRVGKTRVNIFDWEDEAESVADIIAKQENFNKTDKKTLEELLVNDMSWVSSGTFMFKHKTYYISDYIDDGTYDISGGYLFELSEEYDEASKFTTDSGLKVMLKKPENLYSNDDMMNYSKEFFQDFENALISEDGYNSKNEHYSNYADVNSMVSYWLTMEILGNDDASQKSRYCYIDSDGKLHFGPAWDFDWGCGSFPVGTNAKWWKVTKGTLWKDFVDDPFFQIKAAETYWENRDYLESLVEESGFIDKSLEYIIEAGHATDAKYTNPKLWQYDRRDFDTDASIFKTFFPSRLNWLDSVFATNIKTTKSFYEQKNSRDGHYVKNENEMPLKVLNGTKDSKSQHLPADYLIGNNTPVNLAVTCKKAQSDYDFRVFVNGIKVGNADVDDKGYSFELDPDMFTEPVGKRNVVSVICSDNEGNVVYTNYITVILDESITSSEDTFTITYNSNGGSDVASATYNKGDDIDEPDDPTREGYVFTGWYTDEACESLFGFGEMPAQDFTLYAGWQQLESDSALYVLYYVSNGGSTIPVEIRTEPDGLVRPADPERIGYTFGGWYLDKSFEQVFDFGSLKEGTNTVYAKWDINSYSIYFDRCDGSEVQALVTDVYGALIKAPEMPVRDGYQFGGWYKDNSYEHRFLFGRMPAEDITLYASWIPKQYVMRFVTNGGSLVPYIYANCGTTVVAPEEPTRMGYQFAGWYADRELTQEFSFDIMPPANTVVYAKWDRVNYLVSYESNGGTEVETTEVPYGFNIPVPETTPQKEGVVFTGWFEDEECQIPFSFGKMPAEDITLFAGWTEAPYVIRFVSNGGTVIAPMIFENEEDIDLEQVPVLEREGYSFGGWFADTSLTQELSKEIITSGGLTVYAKWDVNSYTITFDTKGGSAIEAITAEYDSTIVAPVEIPEMEGYTFTGWYVDESCETSFEFGNMPAHDQSVYAGWSINSYSVSVDTNGGNEIEAFSLTYGNEIVVDAPSREGYTFTGWYFDSELSLVADLTHMPAHDVQLYAAWEVNSYLIEFDSMGGSAVESQTIAYGQNIAVPENPVRQGYVFLGWYVDEACTELYAFGEMPSHDVKVYAGWEKEKSEDKQNSDEKQKDQSDKQSSIVPVTGDEKSSGTVNAPKLEIGQIYDTTDSNVKCRITAIPEDALAEAAFIYSKDSKEEKVTIPGKVELIDGTIVNITSIDDNAFAKNKTITKVVIGNKIKSIGKKAFYGCSKLKSIVIKTTSLKKKNIGKSAFKGVSSKVVVKTPKNKKKSYKKILKGLPKKARVK